MKLLLFDDDDAHIPQLKDVLALTGHDVKHVRTPTEFAEALQEAEFDGIVLDLMMPAKDIPAEETHFGFKAGAIYYKKLIGAKLGIRFVVLTAVDTETPPFGEAIALLKNLSGFRGWLRKPVRAGDIVALLTQDDERGEPPACTS